MAGKKNKKLRLLSDYVKKECGGNLREAGRKLGFDWTNIDHWSKRGITPMRPYREQLEKHGLIAG